MCLVVTSKKERPDAMLKVLMFLFENYVDRNTNILTDNKTIGLELTRAGFDKLEVEQALAWLRGFMSLDLKTLDTSVASKHAMRVFSDEENEKLSIKARGLLIFLEQVGILNPATREVVINQLMALEYSVVDAVDVKWVVMIVLFHQSDSKQALALMQDLVMHGEAVH